MLKLLKINQCYCIMPLFFMVTSLIQILRVTLAHCLECVLIPFLTLVRNLYPKVARLVPLFNQTLLFDLGESLFRVSPLVSLGLHICRLRKLKRGVSSDSDTLGGNSIVVLG